MADVKIVKAETTLNLEDVKLLKRGKKGENKHDASINGTTVGYRTLTDKLRSCADSLVVAFKGVTKEASDQRALARNLANEYDQICALAVPNGYGMVAPRPEIKTKATVPSVNLKALEEQRQKDLEDAKNNADEPVEKAV